MPNSKSSLLNFLFGRSRDNDSSEDSFYFLHNNPLDLRRNLLEFPLDAKMQNKKNNFFKIYFQLPIMHIKLN